MKAEDKAALRARKTAIEARLDPAWQPVRAAPVLGHARLSYEVSARTNAIACGGIGLIDEMVRSLGLADAIDRRVAVLKVHKPYFESDHVLNIAYNVLCGGTCLEDLALLRNNAAYLDVLGGRRIPDQTTAGDFLRRFKAEDVEQLMEAINETRRRVWKRLPSAERKLALIDVDGTIAPTWGEKKEGMEVSYKGDWGYHPLLVSLANTQEVLYTKNRPGNRPSHDDAATYMDAAVALVTTGGYQRARLRGDTDFSLTGNFDRWTQEGVEFVFGIDAHASFRARAAELPPEAWKPLVRAPRGRPLKTTPRATRPNVKEVIVRERGFTSLATEHEELAEYAYRPGKCDRDYRMIVLRKTIRVTEGQHRLVDQVRYLFYVTNVGRTELPTADVVFQANARCHQENVIDQLKHGVHAMRMPSDTLTSNWAYMVIASLAWNVKAWLAIVIPQNASARELRRMEFRRFLHSLVMIPTQVVRQARGVVLRLLAWTPWAKTLLDAHAYLQRVQFA